MSEGRHSVWYVRRLLAMGPAELLCRVRREFRKRAWRRESGGRHVRTPPPDCRALGDRAVRLVCPVALSRVQQEDLLAEAGMYLRHEWDAFGLDHVVENPIRWNWDPSLKKAAPTHFGLDINHRDEALVGNVRVTWEKNRHHHLCVLAHAYALTHDETYAEEVAVQMEDWIAQNPFRAGINWTHPLEAAIRLIAWVWCERFLRGSARHGRLFGPASPVWGSIYQHQQFIREAFSVGSSANNHLLGEMAGLYVSAAAWPVFPESAAWRDHARMQLEIQLVRQTFPSGLNREQAFGYHLFVLEFASLVILEGNRIADRLSPAFVACASRMYEALLGLSDVAGSVPRYGDGDEGMAVQFLPRRVPGAHRVRALAESVLATKSAVATGCVAFADAGIYVLASARNTPDEMFVVADGGPHGFLSIAAHAHADALSFTLSVGGVPILVDPGTCCYYTDADWRGYFRSTAAHNTVGIDGADQSQQGGTFLWNTHAATSVSEWSTVATGAVWVACHDGYRRQGVRHERRLELDRGRLSVQDRLTGKGTHRVSLKFHLAPECAIVPAPDGGWIVTSGEVSVLFRLPPELPARIEKGVPGAGWYSPAFSVRVPCVTISAEGVLACPAVFKTMIERTK